MASSKTQNNTEEGNTISRIQDLVSVIRVLGFTISRIQDPGYNTIGSSIYTISRIQVLGFTISKIQVPGYK